MEEKYEQEENHHPFILTLTHGYCLFLWESGGRLRNTFRNINEDSPVLNNIVSAKVENLNGEPVVRVEFSDENGNIVERTWISTKYGIPLQEEYFDQDGQDMGKMNVSTIEDGGDYTDKFIPNKEISWTEE